MPDNRSLLDQYKDSMQSGSGLSNRSLLDEYKAMMGEPEVPAPVEPEAPAPDFQYPEYTPENARAAKIQGKAQEALENADIQADSDSFVADMREAFNRGKESDVLNNLRFQAERIGDEQSIAAIDDMMEQYNTAVANNKLDSDTLISKWTKMASNMLGAGMWRGILRNFAVDAIAGVAATGVSLATLGPDPTDIATAPAVFAGTRGFLRGLKWMRLATRAHKSTAAFRVAKEGSKYAAKLGTVKAGLVKMFLGGMKTPDVAAATAMATKLMKTAAVAQTVTQLGHVAVTTEQWAKTGYGVMAHNMSKAGVPKKVRDAYLPFAAIVYGGIENFGGLHKVNPLSIGADVALAKMVGGGVKTAIGKAALEYGKQVFEEATEEALQDATETSAMNTAVIKTMEQYTFDEVQKAMENPEFRVMEGAEQLKSSFDAFAESLGPLFIMGAVPGAANMRAAVSLAKDTEKHEANIAKLKAGEPLFSKDLNKTLRDVDKSDAMAMRVAAHEIDGQTDKVIAGSKVVEEGSPEWEKLSKPQRYMFRIMQAVSAVRNPAKPAILVSNLGPRNGRRGQHGFYYSVDDNISTWMFATFGHEDAHEAQAVSREGGRYEDSEAGRLYNAVLQTAVDTNPELANAITSMVERLYAKELTELTKQQADDLMHDEVISKLVEGFAADEQFWASMLTGYTEQHAQVLSSLHEFFKVMSTAIEAQERKYSIRGRDENGVFDPETIATRQQYGGVSMDILKELFEGKLGSMRAAMVNASRSIDEQRRTRIVSKDVRDAMAKVLEMDAALRGMQQNLIDQKIRGDAPDESDVAPRDSIRESQETARDSLIAPLREDPIEDKVAWVQEQQAERGLKPLPPKTPEFKTYDRLASAMYRAFMGQKVNRKDAKALDQLANQLPGQRLYAQPFMPADWRNIAPPDRPRKAPESPTTATEKPGLYFIPKNEHKSAAVRVLLPSVAARYKNTTPIELSTTSKVELVRMRDGVPSETETYSVFDGAESDEYIFVKTAAGAPRRLSKSEWMYLEDAPRVLDKEHTLVYKSPTTGIPRTATVRDVVEWPTYYTAIVVDKGTFDKRRQLGERRRFEKERFSIDIPTPMNFKPSKGWIEFIEEVLVLALDDAENFQKRRYGKGAKMDLVPEQRGRAREEVMQFVADKARQQTFSDKQTAEVKDLTASVLSTRENSEGGVELSNAEYVARAIIYIQVGAVVHRAFNSVAKGREGGGGISVEELGEIGREPGAEAVLPFDELSDDYDESVLQELFGDLPGTDAVVFRSMIGQLLVDRLDPDSVPESEYHSIARLHPEVGTPSKAKSIYRKLFKMSKEALLTDADKDRIAKAEEVEAEEAELPLAKRLGADAKFIEEQVSMIRQAQKDGITAEVYGLLEVNAKKYIADKYKNKEEYEQEAEYDALFSRIISALTPARDSAIGPQWRKVDVDEVFKNFGVRARTTPLVPSRFGPKDTIFNTPALRNNHTYAWRSMGALEYEKLVKGQKIYEGSKVATKGNFLAGAPESAAQYEGKGRYLVEFGGVKIEGDEGLVDGSVAGKGNVTRVWRHDGNEWVDTGGDFAPPDERTPERGPRPESQPIQRKKAPGLVQSIYERRTRLEKASRKREDAQSIGAMLQSGTSAESIIGQDVVFTSARNGTRYTVRAVNEEEGSARIEDPNTGRLVWKDAGSLEVAQEVAPAEGPVAAPTEPLVAPKATPEEPVVSPEDELVKYAEQTYASGDVTLSFKDMGVKGVTRRIGRKIYHKNPQGEWVEGRAEAVFTQKPWLPALDKALKELANHSKSPGSVATTFSFAAAKWSSDRDLSEILSEIDNIKSFMDLYTMAVGVGVKFSSPAVRDSRIGLPALQKAMTSGNVGAKHVSDIGLTAQDVDVGFDDGVGFHLVPDSSPPEQLDEIWEKHVKRRKKVRGPRIDSSFTIRKLKPSELLVAAKDISYNELEQFANALEDGNLSDSSGNVVTGISGHTTAAELTKALVARGYRVVIAPNTLEGKPESAGNNQMVILDSSVLSSPARDSRTAPGADDTITPDDYGVPTLTRAKLNADAARWLGVKTLEDIPSNPDRLNALYDKMMRGKQMNWTPQVDHAAQSVIEKLLETGDQERAGALQTKLKRSYRVAGQTLHTAGVSQQASLDELMRDLIRMYDSRGSSGLTVKQKATMKNRFWKTLRDRSGQYLVEHKGMDIGEDNSAERAQYNAEVDRMVKGVMELGGGDFMANPLIDISDPYVASNYIRALSLFTAGKYAKALEWYKSAGLLSGPSTILQNLISNGARLLYELGPKGFVQAAIHRMAGDKFAYRKYRAMNSAVWADIAALSHGRAWKAFGMAYRTELPTLTASGWGSKQDTLANRYAIKGTKGRVVRTGYRMLTAGDEYFKELIREGMLTYMAIDSLNTAGAPLTTSNMSQEVMDHIDDHSSKRWQSAQEIAVNWMWQGKPGALGEGMIAMRKILPGGEMLFPFVVTPMNIFTHGLRMSPLGVINIARKSVFKNKDAQGNRYFKNFNSKEFVSDVSEQALAWGTLIAIAAMAGGGGDDEKISGGSPMYQWVPRGKGKFEREEIMPPRSIKLWGKIIDYSRIEPLATMLPPIVDLLRASREARSGRAALKAYAEAFGRVAMAMQDQTWLGSLQDIMRAYEEPAGLPKFAQRFTISWMPNIFRQTARSMDAFMRDTRVKGETFSGQWMADYASKGVYGAIPLPGDKDATPHPRVDIWGRDITTTGGDPRTDVLLRLYNASGLPRVRIPHTDNLSRMILRWNNHSRWYQKDSRSGKSFEAYYPAPPQKWISSGRKDQTGQSGKIYLSDEQYHKYAALSGRIAADMLKSATLDFDSPTVYDIQRIKKVRERARSIAAKRILLEVRREEGI